MSRLLRLNQILPLKMVNWIPLMGSRRIRKQRRPRQPQSLEPAEVQNQGENYDDLL
jgi:hypothetical protein